MSGDAAAGRMAVIDALPEATLLLERDGGVLAANPAACRLLAQTRVELTGRPLATLVYEPPAAVSELLQRWARGRQFTLGALTLLTTGGVQRCRADGALVQPSGDAGGAVLLLRLQPHRQASSGFLALNQRIDALTREVAARRAAERTLVEQREWMRVTLRSIGDAVIATDGEGRVLLMNPVAEALCGWTAAAAAGRRLDEVFVIVNEDTRAPVESPVAMVLREGRIVGLANHTLLLRPAGGESPIDDAAAPIVDDQGRTRGVVLVFRDISERMRDESRRAIFEAQMRDAQKMQAIGTLAGGIAHDFNNVLGSILTNAALARDPLHETHPSVLRLQLLSRAAERARDLVRQIVTFSRQEPQVLRRQRVRPLVDEAISMLRGTLPSVVQLECVLTDEPLAALLDATQFEQVVLNLCTNAWHASQGSTGWIRVTLDEVQVDADGAGPDPRLAAGRYAHLQVADGGCGMDEATMARIFEPFYTTKPAGQGTGLGLSVVHGIVAEHRGVIAVHSRVGVGTRFDLYFPAVELDELQPAAPPAVLQPARGDGLHVLYVDDDEIMVITVEALLMREGYRVTGCASGAEAIALVRARPQDFDAVIADFNMPGSTGLDVARAVRGIRADLPVAITSGYLSDDLRSGAADAGVRALLNKENTLEQLCALLSGMLPPRPAAPPGVSSA
ncbi:MAG TPA: PAS domain-containing protein [Rubrivivax sp.]